MRVGILRLGLVVAIFGGGSAMGLWAQAKVDAASAPVAPAPEKLSERMEAGDNGELALQSSAGTHELLVRFAGFKIFSSQIEVKEGAKPQMMPVVLQLGSYSGPRVFADSWTPAEVPKDDLVLSIVPFAKKFTVTMAERKAMPQKTVKIHNAHSNADETYSGVVLSDLLQKYGVPLGKELRGPALGYYVVATGSDGYKAVYSLAELDPSFHPGEVLVADSMDGKPLDEHSGPLRLVSTEDLRPARGVRNLMAIDVRAAD